jgi:hypothetical protein
VKYLKQADFIRQWDRLCSTTQDTADQYTSNESGMGAAFKVLHQRKSVTWASRP